MVHGDLYCLNLNTAARAVVLRADGLTLRQHRLMTVEPHAMKPLRASIEGATARGFPETTSLMIPRPAPLQPYIDHEMDPGPSCQSDAQIDDHIRRAGLTSHHPLGTCKMGLENDESSVVDQQLRVRGVEGLRVVDAAVMPDLIAGNINAPVMMIAAKAADSIIEAQ